MKHLLLAITAILFFHGAISYANTPIEIKAINGVSNYDHLLMPHIYGYISGPLSNPTNPNLCELNGMDLCNNCPQNMSSVSCTTKRIYGNLQFSITFQVTQDLPAEQQYYAFLGYDSGNNMVLFSGMQGMPVQKGSVITLIGHWGELCQSVGVTASGADACAGSSTDVVPDTTVSIVLANSPSNPLVGQSGADAYMQYIATSISAPQ